MLIKGDFGTPSKQKKRYSEKYLAYIKEVIRLQGEGALKDYLDAEEERSDDGLLWANVEWYKNWQIRMCYDPVSKLHKAFGFEITGIYNDDGEPIGRSCSTLPMANSRDCGRAVITLIDLIIKKVK